jgi:hypothetical protein
MKFDVKRMGYKKGDTVKIGLPAINSVVWFVSYQYQYADGTWLTLCLSEFDLNERIDYKRKSEEVHDVICKTAKKLLIEKAWVWN